MAKQASDLINELQAAVAKADADQKALQTVQANAGKKVEAAKASYDAVALEEQAKVTAAQAKVVESNAAVRALRADVNKVLDLVQDPRVRVG